MCSQSQEQQSSREFLEQQAAQLESECRDRLAREEFGPESDRLLALFFECRAALASAERA